MIDGAVVSPTSVNEHSENNLAATFNMLGKRKRETRVVSRREKPTKEPRSIPDLNSIFRKHFEESFAPLPETSSNLDEHIDERVDSSEDSIEDSEVSDWSGLSDSDNDQVVVEVIDHTLPQNDHEIDRAQKKAFMVRLTRLEMS